MRFFKLLTLLFLFTSGTAFGHQDFWMTKEFGNVKVRIKTGFKYEEIKKSWIIGELANRLCKELRYTKPVFIDFSHYYISHCEPDYFLSFDNGAVKEKWASNMSKPFLKQPGLVIREVSKEFSPSTTLMLLEYAIKHVVQIKNEQKTISYNDHYNNWELKTIDTLRIKSIAAGSASEIVKKVLSTRVNNAGAKELSYYFKDNKYHIFHNDHDTTLLVVNNIYQWADLSNDKAIIFNSDTSFYYVNIYSDEKITVSAQMNIRNTYDNFRPYEINMIGSYKVGISFWYNDHKEGDVQPKERIVVYKINDNELIQDLDEQINIHHIPRAL